MRLPGSGSSRSKASTVSVKKTTPRTGNSIASKLEKDKEAEKAAWERRRSYDPRKAVKEVSHSPSMLLSGRKWVRVRRCRRCQRKAS